MLPFSLTSQPFDRQDLPPRARPTAPSRTVVQKEIYACNIHACRFRTDDKSTIDRHNASHEPRVSRQFKQCPFCDHRTRQNTNLQGHINRRQRNCSRKRRETEAENRWSKRLDVFLEALDIIDDISAIGCIQKEDEFPIGHDISHPTFFCPLSPYTPTPDLWSPSLSSVPNPLECSPSFSFNHALQSAGNTPHSSTAKQAVQINVSDANVAHVRGSSPATIGSSLLAEMYGSEGAEYVRKMASACDSLALCPLPKLDPDITQYHAEGDPFLPFSTQSEAPLSYRPAFD
ncbi:hypothetical protein OBBRIDRAFT_805436 [Obba rivulosa]|uniref:C2H2-type domain-containing protein n=1 Tax=Obba rivulosa TaxID=1052685 RepID=A0A8E2AQ67_9APHY|nr:hypothetical protein OBBRIDRAFT_805436 [Obba rivulosa]